jgi:cytochrome c
VYPGNESGGRAIALDPGFATNHWVFVYYSPSSTSVDRFSRFSVTGDSLDLASEKVVLDMPVHGAECCHHGAGLVIHKTNGNLWLSTGDNTNSLAGKVLRIHPEADGGYTIPSGNLFPPGTPKTRPEIYLMGERNPFRIGLDPTADLTTG